MSKVIPFKHKEPPPPAGGGPDNGRDRASIINEDHPQYAQGVAQCLLCKHEWDAEIETGITYFECPVCSSEKGHFVGPCGPPDDVGVYVCNCGNSLFVLTDIGHMCPNCGIYNHYE